MTVADRATPNFPMQRSCPFSPPSEYREIRENAPISRVNLPNGTQAWALTRLADIRAMLTDPRFSSDRRNPAFPILNASGRVVTDRKPAMIGMDPPEHGAARKAVVGEFTVKRMSALRPRIQQIVDEHIDAMLAGPRPVDLVRALALPVPSLVICEQLGVPYADHDFFQSRSSRLLNLGHSPTERRHAVDDLDAYLDELVTRKEREPGDDLLSRQIANGAEHTDLVGLAFLLLVAGHETTANMISLGTVTLLERPDQLALIREDPSRTLNAIEELLRYFTIAETATSRVATEDAEIGGVTIKAGEGVVGLSNAGNRDPEAFEDPDAFDVTRGARHHVAFGFGAHQCLGQNLARMELQIVFDTLFRRIPGLTVAKPIDELPFKHDSAVFGLHELPVTW